MYVLMVKLIIGLQNWHARTNGGITPAQKKPRVKQPSTLTISEDLCPQLITLVAAGEPGEPSLAQGEDAITSKTSHLSIELTPFLRCHLTSSSLFFGTPANFELNFDRSHCREQHCGPLPCPPLSLPPPIRLLYALFTIALMEWDT